MKIHEYFLIVLTGIIIFTGCKNGRTIEFCEGVSVEGAGVKCGTKFSTGEVTILINAKSPFGTDKLTLDVMKKDAYKSVKTETQYLPVDPEAMSVKTSHYFYDEGEFIIGVSDNTGKKIAEGNIRIVDVY